MIKLVNEKKQWNKQVARKYADRNMRIRSEEEGSESSDFRFWNRKSSSKDEMEKKQVNASLEMPLAK